MAFSYTTAASGGGTVSCAGTTTVTGVGTNFGNTGNQARINGTITVGGVTKTIISIQSLTQLTVDTAFGTFTNQAYTVQTGLIQTGTDTLSNTLAPPIGMSTTYNRGDLFRIFSVGGLDLTINGTLIVDAQTARLENSPNTSASAVTATSKFTVQSIGTTIAEFKVRGKRTGATDGPFPYVGFDWLGVNGNKYMQLQGPIGYPAKFTLENACVRFGADWLTTNSGQYSEITTSGDICWMLCASGSGTNQGRLRQDNATASINFTAGKTYLGIWLNFGVPQTSLKGYTPINTDGPEINLVSVTTATRISIEDYFTTYVNPAYYAGAQITLLGGAWVRLKNNLLGTNIAWRSSSASGKNVLEFSKQITIKAQDAAGNLLSNGYLYYQPVGSNVAGIRAKNGATDITFDLTQQAISTVSGVATSEFPFAWGYSVANANESVYNYFCTGTTKGAESHTVYSSRYGYDKQSTLITLAGNSAAIPTFVHSSLPTTDKVIATAASITGAAFNFTTKVITVTSNITTQQIYDAYQYALNQTANLQQPNQAVVSNGRVTWNGWTINVTSGTISEGVGLTSIGADAINISGTGKIESIYSTPAGTSSVLAINVPSAGYSVCLYRNGTTKYFGSNLATGTYNVYLSPAEANTYTIAAENYGEKRTQDTLVLTGGSFIFNITDLEDVGITALKATASAYTTLATTEQIYDATAIFRLTETGIKLGQLVARDGLYLDFGTYNVKLKDDASAIVGVASGTITYKSLVINEATKYNAMKATPPATITATDTEQINVLIEDANGDSQLSVLGGDNLGYELWKIPTATATDDYATGTLLATLATNTEVFRFIGISGYDIVGRDVSSGVRRRTSMVKGSYEQAFYVGNQIQLATDAPQLIDTNNKIDELILKVDTNLDVAVSTRLADADYVDPATAQDVWEYATRTLTSAGSSGATLAEIEASTILAKEATSQDIKTTVDALSNYDDTTTQSKLDTLQNTVDNINVDFTPVLNAVDALPTLTEIEAGKVGEIKTKVDTLQNTDLTGIATTTDVTTAQTSIETKIDNIIVDNQAISDQVWAGEPERLKNVATVESTGDQIQAFKS